MKGEQAQINYRRMAKAIDFMSRHRVDQPNLEEVASHVSLSPHHFQRMFSEWVGVSPKQFLHYLNVEHARRALRQPGSTLFDVADATGLSGTGRLHDLFIKIEGMTPGDFKQGGKNIDIRYQWADSLFGELLIASTDKGICHLSFVKDRFQALEKLERQFPFARLINTSDATQENALQIFNLDWSDLKEVKLHLKATDFQLKVWNALLNIPRGNLSTYGKIAKKIRQPSASRAVGTAIGSNPIAYLIPCHRVIQSGGALGGYMWGSDKKRALIGWELAINHNDEIPKP